MSWVSVVLSSLRMSDTLPLPQKYIPTWGADAKANKARMEKKEQGPVQAHIADKLLYRHWTSYNDGRCNHLILFDTQTKTYKDLTPGNYSLIFVVGGWNHLSILS